MTKAELYQKACMLPLLPGVYIIRDKSDTIIYIGKAKRLRIRVSQYFREGVPHDNKVSQMIAHAYAFAGRCALPAQAGRRREQVTWRGRAARVRHAIGCGSNEFGSPLLREDPFQAPPPGLEPRQRVPKTRVLPLHHGGTAIKPEVFRQVSIMPYAAIT